MSTEIANKLNDVYGPECGEERHLSGPQHDKIQKEEGGG